MLNRLRLHLRFNWQRWAILVASSALAFLFACWGIASAPGSFQSGFCLVLAGAALSATGKTLVDLLSRWEAYRQGAYTERAKAVQLVLRAARSLKGAWLQHLLGRITSALPPEQLRLVDEARPPASILEELSRELLVTTWDNRVWIGRSGETSVRAFVSALGVIREDQTAIEIPPEQRRLEAVINSAFGELENRLMADLGYSPE